MKYIAEFDHNKQLFISDKPLTLKGDRTGRNDDKWRLLVLRRDTQPSWYWGVGYPTHEYAREFMRRIIIDGAQEDWEDIVIVPPHYTFHKI